VSNILKGEGKDY